jgi:hypothetical protein
MGICPSGLCMNRKGAKTEIDYLSTLHLVASGASEGWIRVRNGALRRYIAVDLNVTSLIF